jgi:hypothetical protein
VGHGNGSEAASRIIMTSGILYTWLMAVTSSTYRYIQVCTGMYASEYVPVSTDGKFEHDGTYQYIPVRTGTEKITISTYEDVLVRVYRCI